MTQVVSELLRQCPDLYCGKWEKSGKNTISSSDQSEASVQITQPIRSQYLSKHVNQTIKHFIKVIFNCQSWIILGFMVIQTLDRRASETNNVINIILSFIKMKIKIDIFLAPSGAQGVTNFVRQFF